MATAARHRDDTSYSLPLFAAPSTSSSSSSPILISDPLADPNSHIAAAAGSTSASGSFQNEGLLSAEAEGGGDAEFGFGRGEFRTGQLAGTVEFYQRHVFLCYKNPRVWPPRIEAAEFDRLPRLLYAAVVARRGDMRKETRLTICEGHDGTETSNGDVLIFPDMIRYRRLTHFDVDTFVEEVLVKEGEWLPGTPETLRGLYVFVCSHGSRDRRCGVCGPPLISRFREEIELHGLQGKASVRSCSHIGGHKYAGNVIIFGSKINKEVTGHWYGYVAPEDVPQLLEQHIGRGEIVDWLWRGQMGLSEEQQKKSHELRFHLNGETNVEKTELTQTNERGMDTGQCRSQNEIGGCCQENGSGSSSCCQTPLLIDRVSSPDLNVMATHATSEKKRSSSELHSRRGKAASARKFCSMPTWSESWEREDTYAALAIVCAAVSVGVAYSCYKQLR
ncbi:uncharacterized protein LOC126786677 [Argentina anserina]|uniref:uncharacterized protein LOC126786677 n=1 Tax=Argentina anserina TaxID=57926 RepID=UPI0021762DBD|nr:uncharacterized protein LOC126786677 [Potentilla anserina]